jgi:2-(1,2-epoxy-1,2-dihydrophenyl)acetyl-CoA isomerase
MPTAAPGTTNPTVTYAVRDRVATITLNRPESANSLNLDLAHGLFDSLGRADTDPGADAVVIRGAGRRFCAGGDLAAMRSAPDSSVFLAELAGAAHDALRVLNRLSKPTISAVTGAAAGIGFSLALTTDFIVAGDATKFVTAYSAVGLTPDGGLSWLLPRAIGQQRALALIATSDALTAQRALDLGIVTEVCAEQDVVERAHQFAVQLCGRPRHALVEARRLVRSSWTASLDEHLDREAEAISRAVAEESTAALIARFLGER